MSDKKRRRVEAEDGSGGGEESDARLHFRNYVPTDEGLKKLVLPPPKAPSEVIGEHIRKTWEEEEEIAKSQPLNIAPRRPNFDLKRDVARKMQRLNIRTQLAIADIIREKLSGQEGGDGSHEGGHQLAAAVMSAKAEDADQVDDMD